MEVAEVDAETAIKSSMSTKVAEESSSVKSMQLKQQSSSIAQQRVQQSSSSSEQIAQQFSEKTSLSSGAGNNEAIESLSTMADNGMIAALRQDIAALMDDAGDAGKQLVSGATSTSSSSSLSAVSVVKQSTSAMVSSSVSTSVKKQMMSSSSLTSSKSIESAMQSIEIVEDD